MNERQRQLTEQISKLQAELMEESRKEFGIQSEALFASLPEITAFQWTQYTPYFNDGYTCTFWVNTDSRSVTFQNGMRVNLEEIYVSESKWWDPVTRKSIPRTVIEIQKQIDNLTIEDENSGNQVTLEQLGITYERAKQIRVAISQFLGSFTDDFMESTFGDHVIVTLNSDWSTDDDHYEHD